MTLCIFLEFWVCDADVLSERVEVDLQWDVVGHLLYWRIIHGNKELLGEETINRQCPFGP